LKGNQLGMMNLSEFIKNKLIYIKFVWKFGLTGYDKQSEPDCMDIEGVGKEYFKKKTVYLENKKGD